MSILLVIYLAGAAGYAAVLGWMNDRFADGEAVPHMIVAAVWPLTLPYFAGVLVRDLFDRGRP